MIKNIVLKIKDKYKLGCCWVGLIAVILPILPNIVWQIAPPANNPIASWASPHMALNAFEWVFRALTLTLLIFVINKNFMESKERDKKHITVSVIVLAVYYIVWVCYYLGITSRIFLVLGLAVPPPLYFGIVAMWRKNVFAVLSSIVFLALHISVVITSF